MHTQHAANDTSIEQFDNTASITTGLALFGEAVLVALVVCFVIHADARFIDGMVGEGSLTSNVQLLFLLITITWFGRVAVKAPQQRGFAILVAGFFATLLVRELDQAFDLVFHGFWKFPAIAIAASAITYAYQNRHSTTQPLIQYSHHQSFGMMVTSIVGLLVISRLFGMGDLWRDLMGSHYLREVKNLVEEGGELVAYAWIMLAASHYCRQQLKALKPL